MSSPKTPLTTNTLIGILSLATVVAVSFLVRDRVPGAARLEASTAGITPPFCSAELVDDVTHTTMAVPRVCETGYFLEVQQITDADRATRYFQLSPKAMVEWRTHRAEMIAAHQQDTNELAQASKGHRALLMWDDPDGHPLGTCVQRSYDTTATCTVNTAR